jgi:hypothetical protein
MNIKHFQKERKEFKKSQRKADRKKGGQRFL